MLPRLIFSGKTDIDFFFGSFFFLVGLIIYKELLLLTFIFLVAVKLPFDKNDELLFVVLFFLFIYFSSSYLY